MSDEYQIHLNFLPVMDGLSDFVVHRRLRATDEPRPHKDVMGYRLPVNLNGGGDWSPYWISIEPFEGFDRCKVSPRVNSDLTCRVLFWSLLSAAKKIVQPDQLFVPDTPFSQELSFIQRRHSEGTEQLEVQPYHLKALKEFGFLVNFHFRLRDGGTFSRKVQQLSLSLDKSFRRNLDCYIDRSAKIRTFLEERQDVFNSLELPNTNLQIVVRNDLTPVRADRLRSKTYVFAGNRESRGQFSGLRDHGPLRALDKAPRLLFIFREHDRQAARALAQGLRGVKQRYSFPGFESLFKVALDIDSNPVVLKDLSQPEMEQALARVRSDREAYEATLPVLILPAEDDAYVMHKALFTAAGIPSQVCTLRVLQDEDTLKWAIANLALQIFCKAGGYPWKVRPTAPDQSLIIGISQSHKVVKGTNQFRVEKYFAFSVMTDDSGLFQRIQVLGDSPDESRYLSQLRQNLSSLLNESAQTFSRVVVHTSFKLKHREMDAIEETVKQAAGHQANCRFAVVKVNHRSKFFGVNRRVNSLVPYEATRVKLGPREYLVWFEGIFPDHPTVTKAFPGPTHLQILRVSDEQGIPDDRLLQDLVNLSGANWRGFNAKSAPVSVFYCHLVADMVHEFYDRGLPLPAVKDIRPWFL